MKITGISVLALAGAMLASAPAAAQDAFATFNGTQGAGNFYYGAVDSITPGASGTFFAVTSGCAIAGTTCLQETAGNVPGVYKTTGGAGTSGTVIIPDDRLILHTPFDNRLTFAFFLAPTAGTYDFATTFSVQDQFPTGVDLFTVDTAADGGQPLTFTSLGFLDGTTGPQTFNFTRTLAANAAFAVAIGRRGTNTTDTYDDSTGLQFTATAVPEPATWGMMLLGAGMVGFGLRSRRKSKVTTRVAFG